MKSFLVISSFCLCMQTPAIAQAYKCAVDGKVVYQGAPCATNSQQVDLSGAGKSDLTSSGATYMRKEVSRFELQDKQENARLQRQVRVSSAIASKQAIVGMNAEELLQSWGKPTKINQTVSGTGASEQWVYRLAGGIEGQYVYLTNGIVQSIQSPK